MGVVPDSEKIKISALPIKTSAVGNDSVVISDSEDSNATKKVLLDDLSKGLNNAEFISSDADNLITQGSDDKLRLDVDNDLKSSDAGNIMQKGTDGKVYIPTTAATLTENNMWIGGATNTPEEKTSLEVRSFLGLPPDYIKDDIKFVSSNQVSWQGECRDSSNYRDFKLTSATTASLVSPIANTKYNLFVASNTLTDTPVVIWDTAVIPSEYTYYRRVLSIVTDGIGNIIPFISRYNQGGRVKIEYNPELYTDVIGTTTTLTKKKFTAPANCEIFGLVQGTNSVGNREIQYSYDGTNINSISQIVYNIPQYWHFNFSLDSNSEIYIRNNSVSSETNTVFRTKGYYDERND